MSSLARFVLQAGRYPTISLAEEEKQLDILSELMRLGKKRKQYLAVELDVVPADLRIPSLVLITLAEGMFKYGDLSDVRNPGRIRAEKHGYGFRIVTKNRIATLSDDVRGTGTGLKNLAARVRLYYGNKASFRYYTKDKTHFVTELIWPGIDPNVPDGVVRFYS